MSGIFTEITYTPKAKSKWTQEIGWGGFGRRGRERRIGEMEVADVVVDGGGGGESLRSAAY